MTDAASAQQPAGTADNTVRYYNQDGVTFREVRSTRKRPVVETDYEQRERTVYREQVETETVATTRTYYVPVTEYQLQARWHGLLNPFVEPHLAYHQVPVTRWEARTEEVRRPVVTRTIVPETTVVNVPVRRQRMVEEQVITRTAVANPAGIAPAAANVASLPIGGTQLKSDPPRDGWRSASGTRRY